MKSAVLQIIPSTRVPVQTHLYLFLHDGFEHNSATWILANLGKQKPFFSQLGWSEDDLMWKGDPIHFHFTTNMWAHQDSVV